MANKKKQLFKRIFHHCLHTILSEDDNPLYRTTVVTNGVENILQRYINKFIKSTCRKHSLYENTHFFFKIIIND